MSSNITPPPKAAKFIFAATIAVIILIALGTVRQNHVLIIIGVALIMVIFGFAITSEKMGAKSGGGKAGAAQPPVQYGRYLPILADERTKQHPEVQRLLQYTEVQRVFFDPSSLSKPATANDEQVRELLMVLDEMLAQGAINGTVYGAQNAAPQMIFPAQAQMQPIKPEKQESTPKRKLGLVLQYIGLLMFFLPFLSVIFIGISPEKTSSMVKVIPVVVTTGAPLGMVLVAIGRIIRRR